MQCIRTSVQYIQTKNHLTTYPDTLPGRSRFECVHCFEKISIVEGVKGIFVPGSDNLCMGTEILDLTMQKVSTDIFMIIWHKRYQIIF